MSRLVHLLPVFASAVILAVLGATALAVSVPGYLVTALPWALTLGAYLWVGRRGGKGRPA